MTKYIIIKLIIFYSQIYGIDPKLSLAVAKIESNFNPSAVSQTADYGVFQLNSGSFPQYTKDQLLDPKVNIPEGIKYLAKMKKECKFKNNNEFLVCFNYGKKNANKVHYPKLWPYKVKVELAMKGF